ncbi:MAG: CBS domain-containing protein [Proteobacteria bacterium]|nr:CBS domain-containing protein [Pseudomonadota bacterium]NIS68633.1 CBS domain-containing protein [Pseudomonadota bacterium]
MSNRTRILSAVPKAISSFRESEYTVTIILAIFVGILGGFGAIGFRLLIQTLQNFFYRSGTDLLEAVRSISWHWRILVPTVGGAVVGPLIFFFAREAKGHGVPEVMEAVAMRSGLIRKRVVIVKSLASAISIGTGGSVGREGPIVQIGSAIGSTLGQILRVSGNRMRNLVGCGAAAGIAATFNAPIAGAIFALEVILGEFTIGTFGPIVLSSVMATVVSRAFLGNYPAFDVPKYNLVSIWEIPAYLIMGILAGFVALLFTKSLYKAEDLWDDLKFPEYLKPALGGLTIGCLALFFPHILGVGYESITLALLGKLSWFLLLALVLVKIAATSLTIGSGGSGGIFAPSLFIGAMMGGIYGLVVHNLFPSVTASSGAYSLVGMGAIVAGTTHAPITAILILFELTDDYRIILPLMLACIISTVTASQLKRESIYTMKLVRRGIDVRAGREVSILKSMLVKDFMLRNIVPISEHLSLNDLLHLIKEGTSSYFPVLNSKEELVGILSLRDIRPVLLEEGLMDLVIAKDIMTEAVITLTSDQSLYDAMEKFGSKDIDQLPVVDTKNPKKVLGMLKRTEVIAAYNNAVVERGIEKK